MKAFLDSNVAVYALAGESDPRREAAIGLIGHYGGRRQLVVSVQVLMETYSVLTRKKRLPAAEALAAAQALAGLVVVAPSGQTALDALALAGQHQLGPYDALIVQTALEAGCDTLFSEDLQAGRRFGKLEVVNPVAPTAHEPVAAYAVEAQAVAKNKPPKPAKPPLATLTNRRR